MLSKTCFFIGHREAGEELLEPLRRVIERHITEYGVTEFVVGQYGNFDRLAARALAEVKQRCPEVRLLLLLPYHPAERRVILPKGFDGSFYPLGMETVPRRAAIVRANRYMAGHSQYLVAYVCHAVSNAAELLEYAEKRGVLVTNLGGRA